MFGVLRRFFATDEATPNYDASEKYADALFGIVKGVAKEVALSMDDLGPEHSDVAPQRFRMRIENRWPRVRDALLEPLTPQQNRELTGFALMMPTSGLTKEILAEMKEQFGDEKAFHYGAEYWTNTLFNFYVDRLVEGLPR